MKDLGEPNLKLCIIILEMGLNTPHQYDLYGLDVFLVDGGCMTSVGIPRVKLESRDVCLRQQHGSFVDHQNRGNAL